jgi:metallo-beta-lactamase family protein
LPILKDPESLGSVNYIISESTYGGRVHAGANRMQSQLEDALKDAVKRGGKIIVPAFSVGRTQELVFALSKLFEKGIIPRIPIYVDSPLSASVSDVFKIHHECFDKETSELISKGVDVFGFSNLTYIKDVEESKSLNEFKGPCMIISASGMCEAGRVLHHLSNNISDPRSTILIIGFMAPNTLGRRLVESREVENPVVRIFGEEHLVRAKIVVLNSFSAHADRNELIGYFEKLNKTELESVFLVHGDLDQQEALKQALSDRGQNNIQIPERGEEVMI